MSCHSYEHSMQDLKSNSTTLLSEFCTNSNLNNEIIHICQLQRPHRWNNHVNFCALRAGGQVYSDGGIRCSG